MITQPIIFEHHFEDKPTYVIGNWCLNGCQFFHQRRALEVFETFCVPARMRIDVTSSFSDEDVDMFAIQKLNILDAYQMIDMVDNSDEFEFLKQFTSEPNFEIRSYLADKRFQNINKEMIDDKDWYVRIRVAYGLNDFDLLKHMLDSNLNDSYTRARIQHRIHDLGE